MRESLKVEFLNMAGIKDYKSFSLPMDASLRSYDRIDSGNKNFILMNCPPEYTSIDPFIKIAKLLADHNLKTPEIFYKDSDNGFILMEDFGDVRIKDILTNNDDKDYEIYKSVIDLLISIQKVQADDLESHDIDLLLGGIETYIDWYFKLIGRDISPEERFELLEIWREKLLHLPDLGKVIVLRDFHAENLMHIESGFIGILDFQDARLGHPAYDLVSLLQDARYEVSDSLEEKLIDYYFSNMPDIDQKTFLKSYNILGEQRNSRILGVFARKSIRDKRDQYLELIPRVKRYLEKNLRS